MMIGARQFNTGRAAGSLESLMSARSSSRVLNLVQTHRTVDRSGSPMDPPLFQSPTLRRSFIIKHRMRPDERLNLPGFRATATKVIIPIDPNNLAVGGKSSFVSEAWFGSLMTEATGTANFLESPDGELLKELDKIPSFDPFLLREWLARMGRVADERYFNLTPSVIEGMEQFVLEEISLLVSMALSGQPATAAVLRLARKMLSSQYDDDLRPLQEVLRMSPTDFRDGMFGWKGLLYYKWLFRKVDAAIPGMISGMTEARPKRQINREQIAEADAMIRAISNGVHACARSVQVSLLSYDNAYRGLTQTQDPIGFRAFLLRAPQMFIDLGESVGLLEHSVEFWGYRSKLIQPRTFTGDDYLTLVNELKEGLGV
jgi:hypothetical protein